MNKYVCTDTRIQSYSKPSVLLGLSVLSLETLMAVWPQTECKKKKKKKTTTKQWQYLNLVVVPRSALRHHEHFAGLLGSVAVLSLEVLEQSHEFHKFITGSVLVPRQCTSSQTVY